MSEIKINGLVTVGDMKFHEIEGGFGKDKKSMLVKEIADIHGKELYHVNELINNNRKRFVDGEDLIDLLGIGLNDTEIMAFGFTQQAINSYRGLKASGKTAGIYVLSERGYFKLLKLLEDELAWEKYGELLDGYFHMRKEIKEAVKAANKKFSLASFNHLLEINIRQMKAAAEPATHIAAWTNGLTRDVLSPFGINVPALPDTMPVTYDATEMAKKLGVYSKSGNPHPQPITAIIKEVGLAPGETFTTETTAHMGKKDVPDVRYAESVLEKVRKWLEEHQYPNPIPGVSKNYNVVYKKSNSDGKAA
jgi:hypothetical protein